MNSIYANRFVVFHDANDFVIKIGVADPENNAQTAWALAMYIAPCAVKALTAVLAQAIADYEKRFQVEIPPMPTVTSTDELIQ
ncbi:hypothetical protein V3F56_06305 [Moorellaceae bacterium AZ2]